MREYSGNFLIAGFVSPNRGNGNALPCSRPIRFQHFVQHPAVILLILKKKIFST
jgi:hypothetical protein